MSTCRGTWGDDRVPSDVGVLACVKHDWVSHDASPRCPIGGHEPHMLSQCGEFDPPRPGFEPPLREILADRPPGVWVYDWQRIYVELDGGRSMFSVLDEHCQRVGL